MKLNIEAPEVGIYENIPFEDYLKIQAVSNSYLSRLAITPAHARVKEPDSLSKSLGRMVHTMVLESVEEFNVQYVVAPVVDKRTKAGKAEWAEFVEGNTRIAITQDDLNKVNAIYEAVLSHPRAAELLSENVSESTIIWEDPETGILCKARPDAVPNDHNFLIDLKTTRDASPQGFTRAIMNYGYYRQAAHYLNGMRVVSGLHYDSFIFIAVEKVEPYRVGCYTLDRAFLGYGETEIERLMQVDLACKEQGYPHYTPDTHTGEYESELELPPWI